MADFLTTMKEKGITVNEKYQDRYLYKRSKTPFAQVVHKFGDSNKPSAENVAKYFKTGPAQKTGIDFIIPYNKGRMVYKLNPNVDKFYCNQAGVKSSTKKNPIYKKKAIWQNVANMNPVSFGYEFEDRGRSNFVPTADQVYVFENIAAYFAKKYKMPIDRKHICKHGEINPVSRANDPGDSFKLNPMVEDIKKIVAGKPASLIKPEEHIPVPVSKPVVPVEPIKPTEPILPTKDYAPSIVGPSQPPTTQPEVLSREIAENKNLIQTFIAWLEKLIK